MQKYKIRKLNCTDDKVWASRTKDGYKLSRLKSEGMTVRRSTAHKHIRYFESFGGIFIAIEVKHR